MFSIIRKSLFSYTKNFNKLKIGSNNQFCSKILLISPKTKVGIWLGTMSAMTVGAVVLGGVTRLTESGLSMTDWHLVKERPPFNESDWLMEFEKYKQFPEYKYKVAEHGSMSLSEFKFIWWMEYSHRMWGRAIGAAFLIPAAVFYYKGYFNRSMKIRTLIMGGLIGFQGLLGWYMVQSGLKVDPQQNSVPRVSQYRLAAHLGSAIALYSLFVWNAFSHLTTPIHNADFPKLKMIRGMTHGVKFFVVMTALSGAFVAGLDAGLIYNSWPKMADRLIPTDLVAMMPRWRNIFENPTTTQFDHRWLGQITGALIFGLWIVCQKNKAHLSKRVQLAVHALAAAAVGQIALGIATLLHYVPVALAASHQTGSLVVLTTALWLSHSLRRIPK